MSVFLAAFLGAVAGAAALIGATVLYVYLKYRQVIRKAEEEQADFRAQFDGIINKAASLAAADAIGFDRGSEYGRHFVPLPSGPGIAPLPRGAGPGIAPLPRGACDGPPNTRMAS